MDFLSHELWGALVFCPKGGRKYIAGVSLGMAPNLLFFGLFHVTHRDWLVSRPAGEISGPPALSILPAYVFLANNLTHSFVMWSVLLGLLWFTTRTRPWLWAA